MEKGAVYQKTDKGAQEIATRSFRLPARERSVLILVDGKRTGTEIIAQAMHFGDAEQFLAHLLNDGFIEPRGSAIGQTVDPDARPQSTVAQAIAAPPEALPGHDSGPPSAPVGAPDPAGGDRMAAFMATKAFATRYFMDMLGPDADALTVKIEGAKTEGQLILLMEKCRDIVQQVKGRDRAERFWQRVQDSLAGRG